MQKPKLLLFSNYYYPEYASLAQLCTDLCEGMTNTFDIVVICSVPCYTGKIEKKYKEKKYYYEEYSNVKVVRVRVPEANKKSKISRIKNILAYFFRALIATCKLPKMDIIISESQPPILGGLLGVVAKFINLLRGKHSKFVYVIQDFNPEQTMAVEYSKNKLILNAMMKLDKFSCKKSNLIITVGRDLIETVNNRFKGKNVPKTVMINNWINEKEIYPLENENVKVKEFKNKYNLENKFIIMYSGNIGLFYDLENIFKVIEKIKPNTRTNDGRDVIFAFVGEGTVLEKLKEYKDEHNMNNVVFIPYQDKKELIYSLNAADVHWCINAKGIKGVSCPSKYYGIAAAGKPILGVLEEGTEVRLIIEETKGGLVSIPEDYDSIEKNIKWFIENADNNELKEMGNRSREHLVSNLTKDISINKYKEEILKLLKG